MKITQIVNRKIFIRITLLLLFTLLVTSTAQTQGQSTPEPRVPDLPPRGAEREVPDREPIVLEQTSNVDGTTSTLIALPATADTYLASERPLQNFGGDSLYLGYNLAGAGNFGAQRMLLRFDVDTFVPDDAVINSATLRLHLLFSSPDSDAPMGTVVRRIASDWNENNVTWNSEPAWTAVDTTANVGSALTYYDWPLTDVVAGWANNLYPNYGIEIIGDEAVQQRERAFYARETNSDLFPRLIIDYTTISDDQQPTSSINALPAYSSRNFTVTWDGTDTGGAGIAYYDVQVQINGGAWGNLVTGTTTTSTEYVGGADGNTYAFRVRAVDNAGNIEDFGPAEASTLVDSMPPATTVDPLTAVTNTSTFIVSWSGSDSASGIQYYDVQYRIDDGPWFLWQSVTTATSASFTAPADGIYAFETRAVDNSGLIEIFQNEPEATTAVDTEAPFITPSAWLPVIAK